jgi:hypothetical protein
MSSIKLLKSEVNYLVFEIISDCNTFISIHPEKRDNALELVQQAVDLRNNCIAKINNGKGQDHTYFKAVRMELIKEADAIFSKLRGLIK